MPMSWTDSGCRRRLPSAKTQPGEVERDRRRRGTAPRRRTRRARAGQSASTSSSACHQRDPHAARCTRLARRTCGPSRTIQCVARERCSSATYRQSSPRTPRRSSDASRPTACARTRADGRGTCRRASSSRHRERERGDERSIGRYVMSTQRPLTSRSRRAPELAAASRVDVEVEVRYVEVGPAAAERSRMTFELGGAARRCAAARSIAKLASSSGNCAAPPRPRRGCPTRSAAARRGHRGRRRVRRLAASRLLIRSTSQGKRQRVVLARDAARAKQNSVARARSPRVSSSTSRSSSRRDRLGARERGARRRPERAQHRAAPERRQPFDAGERRPPAARARG